MSVNHFEFTIDTPRRLKNVPIPKRMARGVKDAWTTWNVNRGEPVLTLQRGTDNNTKQIVKLKQIVWGDGKEETFLNKGWGEFVSSNRLQVGDRIVMSLYNYVDLQYRVRIWRDDLEITGTDAGSDSEDEDSHFKFQFKYNYWWKPTINIPLPFAKKHFNGIEKETKVHMYVHFKKYEGTMHIRRDRRRKIISYSIKKGVLEFIRDEEVEVDDKVQVQLFGVTPNPVLIMMFI